MTTKGTVSIPMFTLLFRKVLYVAELDDFVEKARDAAEECLEDLQDLIPSAKILAINVDAFRPGPGIEVSFEPWIPREKQQHLLSALQKKGYRSR